MIKRIKDTNVIKLLSVLVSLTIIVIDIAYVNFGIDNVFRCVFWYVFAIAMVIYNEINANIVSNIILLTYEIFLLIATVSSYIFFLYEMDYAAFYISVDGFIRCNIYEHFFLNAVLVQPFFISLLIIFVLKAVRKKNK